MTRPVLDTLTYGDDPNGDPGSERPSSLFQLTTLVGLHAEVVVKWTQRVAHPIRSGS